jgi:integrase
MTQVQHLTPTAIEPKHISKWVNHSGSLATRKYKLAVVKSFFTFLIVKGWCQSNPAALVGIDFDALSHEQKEKKEQTPLTEEQVNLLLVKSDDPFWRFATLCAWETGLRLGDICNLEWPSFGTPGKLVVWTGKTNQRVEFNISARLTGLLSTIPVTDSKFVFPEQRRIISDEKKRAGLSTQFTRLCARCGFNGHFHLLRHAAASSHAKHEMSDVLEIIREIGLEKARKILGHKRAKTTHGYVH